MKARTKLKTRRHCEERDAESEVTVPLSPRSATVKSPNSKQLHHHRQLHQRHQRMQQRWNRINLVMLMKMLKVTVMWMLSGVDEERISWVMNIDCSCRVNKWNLKLVLFLVSQFVRARERDLGGREPHRRDSRRDSEDWDDDSFKRNDREEEKKKRKNRTREKKGKRKRTGQRRKKTKEGEEKCEEQKKKRSAKIKKT